MRTVTPVTFGMTFAPHALILTFLAVVSNVLCRLHAANLQGKMLCTKDDKNKQVCSIFCALHIL